MAGAAARMRPQVVSDVDGIEGRVRDVASAGARAGVGGAPRRTRRRRKRPKPFDGGAPRSSSATDAVPPRTAQTPQGSALFVLGSALLGSAPADELPVQG